MVTNFTDESVLLDVNRVFPMGYAVQKSAVNMAVRRKKIPPKSRRGVVAVTKLPDITHRQSGKSLDKPLTFEVRLQAALETILDKSVPKPKTSIETILAEVLEIDGGTVLLHCLMDPEAGIFQTRRFDEKIFQHLPDLEEGQLLALDLETTNGKATLKIRREHNSEFAHLFDPDEILKSISTSGIFRSVSAINESDL